MKENATHYNYCPDCAAECMGHTSFPEDENGYFSGYCQVFACGTRIYYEYCDRCSNQEEKRERTACCYENSRKSQEWQGHDEMGGSQP